MSRTYPPLPEPFVFAGPGVIKRKFQYVKPQYSLAVLSFMTLQDVMTSTHYDPYWDAPGNEGALARAEHFAERLRVVLWQLINGADPHEVQGEITAALAGLNEAMPDHLKPHFRLPHAANHAA